MEERAPYESQFISFQDELKSFLYRIVTHKQESEDLTQETYIKVFHKIDSFEGKSSFKTWVFSIATNLAKDSLRARNRWGEDWMDLVRDAHVADQHLLKKKFEIVNNSPHGAFVMQEHLNYCFNCTSKTLLLKNQICLLLKDVYAFSIPEIMTITNLSEGLVKHAVADARRDLTRIFKSKCALINKNGACSQCTGLNNIFNPDQETQVEANKLKVVKERQGKDHQALLDLRLQMVQSLNPLEGNGIDLHNYLIENSPAWAKRQLALQDKRDS